MREDSKLESEKVVNGQGGKVYLMLSHEISPNQAAFTQLGFSFSPGDKFRYMTVLPEGWTYSLDDYQQKEGFIYDEKGRRRVKFCFDDKYIGNHPFMYTELLCRCYVDVKSNGSIQVQTMNGGKVIGRYEVGDHECFNKLWNKAIEYLDQNYPGWKEPTKYWD